MLIVGCPLGVIVRLEVHEEAAEGGPSVGLDEEGITLFYDLPLSNLSEDALRQAVNTVTAGVSSWREALRFPEEAAAGSPEQDAGGTIRV